MRQRHDLLKEPVTFVQLKKIPVIGALAQTGATRRRPQQRQLLLQAVNDKRFARRQQALVVVIIHVQSVTCKAKRTNGAHEEMLVKGGRTAIRIYYVIY